MAIKIVILPCIFFYITIINNIKQILHIYTFIPYFESVMEL